ncbi:hypothetical protein HZS36_21570 [Kalamiella piersonii]|nr:hypothetical protein [Pantoea piersonii]NYB09235.1 hypothetical protein [Pantoea piersonii]NYB36647.1 hypothetical protein [Pantoea piersonii]
MRTKNLTETKLCQACYSELQKMCRRVSTGVPLPALVYN